MSILAMFSLSAATLPIITIEEPLPVALELPVAASNGSETVTARMYLRVRDPFLTCLFYADDGYYVRCRQKFYDPDVETTRVLWLHHAVTSFEIDEVEGTAVIFGRDAQIIQSRFRRRFDIKVDNPESEEKLSV